MAKSLKKNFAYQLVYQLLALLIPFIVSPYLTRVLGDTGLGIYSYVNSIACYFVLFAMLGISTHGQRIISKYIDDQVALRKAFWSLYILHAVFSIASILLYGAFAFLFGGDNKTIYFIQILYVASALFDITWFFYGLENFRTVVVKNTIIRVSECVLVFILVKTKNDLWIYTLISSLSIFLGQVVLLPQAIKIAKPIVFSFKDVRQHIKPLFIFFIAALASTLFTVFDKTLLGIMVSKETVAYYEFSNKVISIPKVIIIVCGTVMLPRACKLANAGETEEQKKYMNYSFMFASFVGMASIFGLLAIGPLFAVIYFGSDFEICGPIMMALSPVIYTVGAGDVIRTQYMVPYHKEKELTISIVACAFINIVLSIILIPEFGVFGAVIGSVCAEVFEFIFQIVVCRKFISIKDVILPLIPFLIVGLIMFVIIKILSMFLGQSVVDLLILLFVGAFLYCVFSFLYIVIFKREIFRRIINIGKRKKES